MFGDVSFLWLFRCTHIYKITMRAMMSARSGALGGEAHTTGVPHARCIPLFAHTFIGHTRSHDDDAAWLARCVSLREPNIIF